MPGALTPPHPDTTDPTAVGASAGAAWAVPALTGAGALAACLLVAVRDPNQEGSYGYCPFRALTGLDCPGCGMMRGAHALFTGDLSRMLDHNVFLPVVFAIAAFGYVRWFRRSLAHDVRPLDLHPLAIAAVSVAVLGFWVLRNVGGPFEYLASPAG